MLGEHKHALCAGSSRRGRHLTQHYQRGITVVASFPDRPITATAEGASPSCSFCRKGPGRLEELIEGPALPGGMRVYICEECVERCSSIFEHRRLFGGTGEDAEAILQRVKEETDQRLSLLTSLEEDVIRLRHGLGDGFTYGPNKVGERIWASRRSEWPRLSRERWKNSRERTRGVKQRDAAKRNVPSMWCIRQDSCQRRCCFL